ncbi:unnamed protein product, partial [Pleuronectes platessa]
TFLTGSGSGVTVGHKFTRCNLVSPTPLDNIEHLTSYCAVARGHSISTKAAPELGRAAEDKPDRMSDTAPPIHPFTGKKERRKRMKHELVD